MSKRSRPYSDHKLEEPSRMKSDAVNAWLKHWLRLQKRDKRPLVLKDRSDRSSETHANTPAITKKHMGRGKGKGKGRYVESDESDDEEMEDTEDESGPNQLGTKGKRTGQPASPTDDEGNGHGTVLPQSPKSAADSRRARREFLISLSEDVQYHQLLLLLRVAKVS
jgi:hypothetical protein